jgi:CDP-diacylglycerol---serine O-phosphatidyltransferase
MKHPSDPTQSNPPPIITWRQVIPNLFTIAAMLAGFLSILVTFEGMHVSRPELFSRAAQLIMLAMILDGLDGNVARWLKGASAFGAELDTYVDMTAFGIAPAILVYAVSMQTKDPFWRVLLPSAVALSGMVRLARFKVKDPLRGQGGYAGLPITANAAWVALFVFISLSPPRERFALDQGPVATLFLTGIVVFIILQVTNLRYPKPTKNRVMFSICIVLVVLMWILHVTWASRVAVAMIGLGLVYVVMGPLFVKGVAVHKARKEARANRLNGE